MHHSQFAFTSHPTGFEPVSPESRAGALNPLNAIRAGQLGNAHFPSGTYYSLFRYSSALRNAISVLEMGSSNLRSATSSTPSTYCIVCPPRFPNSMDTSSSSALCCRSVATMSSVRRISSASFSFASSASVTGSSPIRFRRHRAAHQLGTRKRCLGIAVLGVCSLSLVPQPNAASQLALALIR